VCKGSTGARAPQPMAGRRGRGCLRGIKRMAALAGFNGWTLNRVSPCKPRALSEASTTGSIQPIHVRKGSSSSARIHYGGGLDESGVLPPHCNARLHRQYKAKNWIWKGEVVARPTFLTQIFPIPCSPFPNHTAAAAKPLRLERLRPRLGPSLPNQRPALTG